MAARGPSFSKGPSFQNAPPRQKDTMHNSLSSPSGPPSTRLQQIYNLTPRAIPVRSVAPSGLHQPGTSLATKTMSPRIEVRQPASVPTPAKTSKTQPAASSPHTRRTPVMTSDSRVPLLAVTASSYTLIPRMTPLPPPSQRTPLLRRKKSNIAQYMSDRRNSPPEMTPTPQEFFNHPLNIGNDRVVDAAAPSRPLPLHSKFSPSPIQTSLPRQETPNLLYAQTPLSEQSTTPSLVFSHASHTTTPTSATTRSPSVSQSPHFIAYSTFSPNRQLERTKKVHREQYGSNPHLHQSGDVMDVSVVDHDLDDLAPHPIDEASVVTTKISPPRSTARPSGLPTQSRTIRSPIDESSRNKTAKPPHSSASRIVRPPELAHLNHAVKTPTSPPQPAPPRPSRDGVVDLGDMQTSSSVVTTHLPHALVNHNRRQSKSAHFASDLHEDAAGASVIAVTHVQPSTKISPKPVPLTTSHSIRRPERSRLSNTAAEAKHNVESDNAKLVTASSQSPHKVIKTGLFSRREKPVIPTAVVDTGVDSTKKGPMAGTGHEGYVTYPTTRRSIGSTTGRRSSDGSATSSTANDILARTAQPVFLRSLNGRIVVGDRSSSNSDVSQMSSMGSVDTSQSSAKMGTTYTDDSSRLSTARSMLSSRGPPSRGRGSWSGSRRGGGPRKLSKDSKNAEQPRKTTQKETVAPPKTSTNAKSVDPILDPEVRSKLKKPGFMSNFFSKSSDRTKVHLGPASSSHLVYQASTHANRSPAMGLLGRPTTKVVAHYLENHIAKPNSLDDIAQLEDIDRIMAEAVDSKIDLHSDLGSHEHSATTETTVQAAPVEISMTLSPELRSQHMQRDEVTATASALAEQPKEPPRPSRLQPVGRIPQVVTRSGQPRAPPLQSFSRPFPGSPPLSHVPARSLPSTTAVSKLATSSRDSQDSAAVPGQETAETREGDRQPSSEFLAMRKNSDTSYSSSSGMFYFATAPAIAEIPAVGSPSSPDEEWPEYDDILEAVEQTVSDSEQTRVGLVQDGYFARRKNTPKIEAADIARSKTAFPNLGEMVASLRPDLSPFAGTERRSRFFSGFEHPIVKSPALSPTIAMDTFIELDGDDKLIRRSSTTSRRDQASRPGLQVPRGKAGSSTSLASDSSALVKLATFEESSLQLAALKVSKWLTFGRVLFSPAHVEYENGQLERILVVDGTGKDWPLFCAQTYPKALVNGLGPSSERLSRTFPAERPKGFVHHTHQVELGVKFPYKKNHFSAVVFRFPTAMDERNLADAIAECKRVLRPGGYLEVTLLDLDPANMGPKARRAVKQLKIKMHALDPKTSLKSASDNVLSHLGRHCFENMYRCVVGVPVAGTISNSPGQSIDHGDSSTRDMTTDGIGSQTDEDMTKLVAKVGRWWYNECYEKQFGEEKSIWSDAGLLRECEEAGTAFKLLVCYAQKPTMNKRKTKSL